jgi:hypothetical protein
MYIYHVILSLQCKKVAIRSLTILSLYSWSKVFHLIKLLYTSGEHFQIQLFKKTASAASKLN